MSLAVIGFIGWIWLMGNLQTSGFPQWKINQRQNVDFHQSHHIPSNFQSHQLSNLIKSPISSNVDFFLDGTPGLHRFPPQTAKSWHPAWLSPQLEGSCSSAARRGTFFFWAFRGGTSIAGWFKWKFHEIPPNKWKLQMDDLVFFPICSQLLVYFLEGPKIKWLFRWMSWIGVLPRLRKNLHMEACFCHVDLLHP